MRRKRWRRSPRRAKRRKRASGAPTPTTNLSVYLIVERGRDILKVPLD